MASVIPERDAALAEFRKQGLTVRLPSLKQYMAHRGWRPLQRLHRK